MSDEVICQTRGRVFHQDIQTPRGGLKKRGAAEFFCKPLRGVWIPDDTLFQVFDIASQTDHNMRRKRRNKIAKNYVN